jgi:hypothetical protein
MPRASELAHRHGVDAGQMQAIIDDLVARQLIRRSPDGRLYRSSPPECLIALDGIPGLGAAIDPMTGELTCTSYGASRRPATEEAADALRIPRGDPVVMIRLTWALNGRPAAVSTTYLARHLADPRALTNGLAVGTHRRELPLPPLAAANGTGHPGYGDGYQVQSAAVQMQLPPSSVARKLRLAAGQMAVLVTALLGDGTGAVVGPGPAALSVSVLRPDMFRITLATGPREADAGMAPVWRLADPADAS